MKIAICQTGFLRMAHRGGTEWLFKDCYPNHEVDVYVATWNVLGASLRPEDNISTPVDEEYIRSLYGKNVKGVWIGDLEEYNKTRTPFRYTDRPNDIFNISPRAKEHIKANWPDRLLDQWYVVKKAYELIPNPDQYDIIMRNRGDIGIHIPIKFDCPNTSAIHIPAYEFDNGIKMEDKFAWGSPAVMSVYMNTYNEIQKMYDEDNTDVSFSEHLLYHYLINRHNMLLCVHQEIQWGTYWSAGANVPHANRTVIETHPFESSGGYAGGVEYHSAGQKLPLHFHKETIEYTTLLSGKMRVRGEIVTPGTIVIARPYEILNFEFLEDSTINITRNRPDINDEEYL